MTRSLLYFLEESFGGVADYAHEQAEAMAAAGVDVELLTTPKFPVHPGARYRLRPDLIEMRPEQPISGRLRRGARFVKIKLENYRRLAARVREANYRRVLIGSFAEYFAPFWSGKLRKLSAEGVVFGAVIHDPVRDYVVGPRWWHNRSVADAYGHLREAFVHEPIDLDTGRTGEPIRTTVIPFGPYSFPESDASREETRRGLDIPADAPMWLAFGNIRDGKNIDYVVRALADCPTPYLVVAGRVQSAGQKQVAYYRNLAEKVGVADRCRWIEEYVSSVRAANLFTAADAAVLTYSGSFRSASSVLALAANYRVPCLASSGQGALGTMVRKYRLGVWVEPDDVEKLVAGMKALLAAPPRPLWDAYFEENSWSVNAGLILDRIFEDVQGKEGRK